MSPEDVTENASWNCWIRTIIAGLGSLCLLGITGSIEAQSAVMLPQLRRNDSFIRVTPDEESWIAAFNMYDFVQSYFRLASISAATSPFSALMIGPFLDSFGRKKGVLAFYLSAGFGFAVVGFARKVYHIYIGRIITGLGMGIFTSSIVYLIEISNKKQREFIFSITPGIFSGGLMISNIINGYLPWNIAALIFSLICFVLFFTQCFIPESPPWLFKIGAEDAAIHSLKCLGRSEAEIKHELETLRLSCNADSERFENSLSQIRQELDRLKKSCDLESLESATLRICRKLDSLKLSCDGDYRSLEKIRFAILSLKSPLDTDLEITVSFQGKVATLKLSDNTNAESWRIQHELDTLKFESFENAICQIQLELDTLTVSPSVAAERTGTLSFLAPTVWKPFIIMVGFCFFQSGSGTYIIIYYTQDFFERMGTGYDPLAGAVLLSTARFIASITITVIFRSKAGRKFSTTSSALWMTVALAGTGIYEYINRDISVAERPLHWVPVAFLVIIMVAMMLGLLTLPWAMAGEVYPLRVRGTLAGATNAIGYGFMFISTKVYYTCVDMLQIWGLLFAFAGVAFVAIFFGAFILPETKGKSLYEIEQGFLPKKNRQLSKKAHTHTEISRF